MMDCITIDFETFFSTDYSLSKMTTEAYIRDPRFEVILVGVKSTTPRRSGCCLIGLTSSSGMR